MNWKKLKKVIIPLLIVKAIFFGFVIFGSDVITISRDINYSSNYQEGFDNDSIILKKQKLIRIVRNEEERGISIKLRAKKNNKPHREEEGQISIPVVD
jgi:regulatory protein YycI of two-component signal transduction system YycFG